MYLSFIIYDSNSSFGEGSRIKAKTRPVSMHDITCRNCMELVLQSPTVDITMEGNKSSQNILQNKYRLSGV